MPMDHETSWEISPPEEKKKRIHGFWPWFGIILTLSLTILALVHLLLPDRAFSASEKRMLKKMPALTAAALSDGTYTEQLETYLADQFPGRSSLMKFRMRLEYFFLRRESEGVYYGKDDYLIERFSENPERTEKTLDAVCGFLERHKETSAFFMIVPTKAGFYPEKLPFYADSEDQDRFIDHCFETLSGAAEIIDPRPWLRAADRRGTQVYYRSDHHWTADGAYEALPEVEKVMELPHQSFSRAVVFNRFSGSLAAKSGWQTEGYDSIVMYTPDDPDFSYFIRDEESGETRLSAFHAEALQGSDPYEFYFGGNVPMLTVETSADTERTLLVFKDSYANCFLPFLFEHYRKIVIIDPRYYQYQADALLHTEDFDDMLFLYNAGTLAEDTSLVKILEE